MIEDSPQQINSRFHPSYEHQSDEQDKALEDYLHFSQSLVSATVPFDRKIACAAINSVYSQANLAPPVIIWTKSPAACLFAGMMTDGLSDREADYNGKSLLALNWDEIDEKCDSDEQIWKGAWESVKASRWSRSKPISGPFAWDNVNVNDQGKTWSDLDDGYWGILLERKLSEDASRLNLSSFNPETFFRTITSVALDVCSDCTKARTWSNVLNELYNHPVYGKIQSRNRMLMRYQLYLRELIIESFLRPLDNYDSNKLKTDFLDLYKATGWVLPYQNICFVSQPHSHIKFDTAGRLHCENGPAVSYPDGFSIYAWHGTIFPKEWADQKPSAQKALSRVNTEQRRVACEMVGWHKILEELVSVTLDEDKDPQIGTLLEVQMVGGEGKKKFLRVNCGTGRDFALPVPPEMKTARQANAWTWGLESGEYKPEVRT